MTKSLICHPEQPNTAVEAISIDWVLQSDVLSLRYHILALCGEIQFPEFMQSARMDSLWQHTCCELFLKPKGANWYCEFNFSPSTAWAAYRFSDYRKDMGELKLSRPPQISVANEAKQFTMDVEVDLPEFTRGRELNLGISAIIVDKSGIKSYWALSHPSGKPDFHHEDCFSQNLKASQKI